MNWHHFELHSNEKDTLLCLNSFILDGITILLFPGILLRLKNASSSCHSHSSFPPTSVFLLLLVFLPRLLPPALSVLMFFILFRVSISCGGEQYLYVEFEIEFFRIKILPLYDLSHQGKEKIT